MAQARMGGRRHRQAGGKHALRRLRRATSRIRTANLWEVGVESRVGRRRTAAARGHCEPSRKGISLKRIPAKS